MADDHTDDRTDDQKVNDPMIGYCVKCREKREMNDVERVQMKAKGGSRPAAKGKCSTCGTGMYRILPKSEA